MVIALADCGGGDASHQPTNDDGQHTRSRWAFEYVKILGIASPVLWKGLDPPCTIADGDGGRSPAHVWGQDVADNLR